MGSLGFYCLGLIGLSLLQACAPQARPWSFPSPVRRAPPIPVFTPPASVGPPVSVQSRQETETPSPVLTESKITEQKLSLGGPSGPAVPRPSAPANARSELPAAKTARLPAKGLLKETTIKRKDAQISVVRKTEDEGATPRPGMEVAPERSEETSLVARITPETPPERAASLRLTEEGKKLLQEKQYDVGLSRLEKAIALDSRNRYAYYYLAQAHFKLTHYQQSLNFLEIIAPVLAEEPDWLARLYALEGENYRALGFFDRADAKYVKALSLDPSNRAALDGLSYIPSEILLPSR